MEAPRSVQAAEFPSLRGLVNEVFMGGTGTDMFEAFPAMFNEPNRENLLVCVDGGRAVSHVGMTQRYASLAGCAVRVACIGAVATYKEYRGQGLASRLFQLACDKAFADGVDFLMISGDRPLYLAAGAAFVGNDAHAIVDADAAMYLFDPAVDLAPVTPADLDACRAAYDLKPARFVRPLDDWQWFVEARLCEGMPVDWDLIRASGGAPCAYIVHRASTRDPGCRRIIEWAGDSIAVAAALYPLMREYDASRLQLHVQSGDTAMRDFLRMAGATLTPEPATGTYLLISFEQLMNRLRPWFESRLGLAAAQLSFAQHGDRFHFALGPERYEVQGKAEAARLIFGHPDAPPREGFLARAFPAPSLRYGLSYI